MAATTGPVRARPHRFIRSYWLWPALLTLAVTLVQIDRAPLWRDELATWSAASRPVGDLIRLAGNIDGVAFLYYLFTHGWIAAFGDSVTTLRLPAAFAMAGAAALLAVLGRRLFDRRTGLVAGLLFAVLPSTSRYGQETRPYALATLFAVLATLLLVRALERPSAGRWAGYALAVCGLGLSHLLATGLVLGHAVAVVLAATGHRSAGSFQRWLTGPVGRWPLALVPAVLVLAPLARLGRDQQARQLAWVSPPSVTDLPSVPGEVTQSPTVGGLLVGLAVVGVARSGRQGALLAGCVLLPTVLLFVGGLATPLWVPRYLLFTVPFGCLLAARTVTPTGLRWALPLVVITGLLGAPAQASLRRTHESPRSAPVDYPAAARIIAAGQLTGDGIVFAPRDSRSFLFLDLAVDYYLRPSRPRDVLLARDPVGAGTLNATECARPAACLAGVDRVWLLAQGQKTDPLRGVSAGKAAALRDGFAVRQVWTVPGLTVALLVRTAPPG